MCSNDKRRAGFSLVEIMVVLVIIGLLAGVVTINVRNYLITGRQNTAKMEVARICEALETFYSVHGRFPDNAEGLAVLTQASDKLPEPMLSRVPVDPWGKPYQYNRPGQNTPYEVISYGADGQEGGSGEDADVVSFDL